MVAGQEGGRQVSKFGSRTFLENNDVEQLVVYSSGRRDSKSAATIRSIGDKKC